MCTSCSPESCSCIDTDDVTSSRVRRSGTTASLRRSRGASMALLFWSEHVDVVVKTRREWQLALSTFPLFRSLVAIDKVTCVKPNNVTTVRLF